VNPWYAKAVVLLAGAAIGILRAAHSYQRPRDPVSSRRGGAREAVALSASFVGFVVPMFWVWTSWLDFADYELRLAPLMAGAVLLAAGLWLFHRTHRDLGRNWSARLQILESHQLVTGGVYRRVRHPMYLALLLFGIGQAAVVPNWIAGASCLVGAVLLFVLRIGPEERMMRERFGRDYEAYAARTNRLVPGVW
jgi:protein-S-isoprenylcysteine O-methyltransferase Ste14